MALTIFLVVLFLVCLSMMWNEGMWSNAITTVNTIFAGLLATNYFEPVAHWLEGQLPSYTYLIDFISIWLVFSLSFVLLRAFTDTLSKSRVRFKLPVEQTGRIAFAALTGWIMICFTCATLHTAPLARTAFKGGFIESPQSNVFLGFAPDRMWLGFVQSCSLGALSQADASVAASRATDQGKRVFDPKGEFILKYGERRNRIDQLMSRSGKIRVGS